MNFKGLNNVVKKSLMAAFAVVAVVAMAKPAFAAVDAREDLDSKEAGKRITEATSKAPIQKDVDYIVKSLWSSDFQLQDMGNGVGNGKATELSMVKRTDGKYSNPELKLTNKKLVEDLEKIAKLDIDHQKALLHEVAGVAAALEKAGSLLPLDREFIATVLHVVANTKWSGRYDPRLEALIRTGQQPGEEKYTPEGMQHSLEVLRLAAAIAEINGGGRMNDADAISEAVEEYAKNRSPEEIKKMKQCMGVPTAS